MKKRLRIVGFSVLCIFALIGVLALFGVLPQLPVEEEDQETPFPVEETPVVNEIPDAPIEEVVEEPNPPMETVDIVLLSARAEHNVPAYDLLSEYRKNEFAADAKYKEKIIFTYGKISDMETVSETPVLTIAEQDHVYNVSCGISMRELPKLENFSRHQRVAVVGVVTGWTGYDVMLAGCVVADSQEYEITRQRILEEYKSRKENGNQ